MNQPLRVAIVHEWLTNFAGSEKVVEQLLQIYPEADVFTLVDFLPEKDRVFLNNKRPSTSFIQNLPGARKHFRQYLALMPLAVEQFDLQSYDLILSSSHAVAKGVLTGPNQMHICYCHSPIRYAWDMQHQYLRESGLNRGIKGWIARLTLHYLRLWDSRTAHGVDQFIGNSRYIAGRIRKVYGRSAAVIHPPVDTEYFAPRYEKESFYFTASRFVPYKRMDLIISAFAQLPDRQLVVIGDGPEFAKCVNLAPPNVKLLGWQPNDVLRDHMQRARAFVFAAEEDFGIAPVEAQACATPVICYGRGGALDSVVEGVTGTFFQQQSADSIAKAIRSFESLNLDGQDMRLNSEQFSPAVFREKFRSFVEATLVERALTAEERLATTPQAR